MLPCAAELASLFAIVGVTTPAVLTQKQPGRDWHSLLRPSARVSLSFNMANVHPNDVGAYPPPEDDAQSTSSDLTELDPEDFPTYFYERGGRLFHSHGRSPYPLPVDADEQHVRTFLINSGPFSPAIPTIV